MKSFIENGAQIIETASYQLSVENLGRWRGFNEEQAREIMKDSVRVAHEARQESKKENVQIAGSVGPYGCILGIGAEFDGSYADSMSEEVIDLITIDLNSLFCRVSFFDTQ